MIRKIAAGNVTSFVYNTEDRLAQVWSGDAGAGELIAEYYYDPFGRRLWKQVGATRIYYHYSDDGLIAEYDATGNEIKAYGWKPDAPWSTDPLFMKQAGQYYFYHNDHLGTPQKLTDLSGAVVWSAKYESFGKAAIEVAAVENNLRFPGQYWDQETGLHYNYFRYYEPGTGRYLRTDPIGFYGYIANYYSYVQNNPNKHIDSFGLFEQDVQQVQNFIKIHYPQFYNENSKILYKDQKDFETKVDGTLIVPSYFANNPLTCEDRHELIWGLAHEYQHANDLEKFNYLEKWMYAADMGWLQRDYQKEDGVWRGRHWEIDNNAIKVYSEAYWKYDICE